MQNKENMQLQGNIMIIVPHGDDEILMTAGVITSALNNGLDLKVVIATNGDYEAATLEKGWNRMRETLEAVKELGLSQKDVIFLGYADTGMEEALSFLTKLYFAEREDAVFPSLCSTHTYGIPGVADDYHYTRFGCHASYTRRNFTGDLYTAINEFMPAHIFVTSLYDTHGDHSALYRFTVDAVKHLARKREDYKPVIHQGMVHSPAGDDKWPETDDENSPVAPFTMPDDLETMTGLKWADREIFPAPEDMSVKDRSKNRKYRAMRKYKSVLNPERPEDIRYLLSFVKSDEVFWRVDY